MTVTTPCKDCGKPVVVALPWPSPALNPNKRQHWARLAKARRAYRARCRAETLQQLPVRTVPPGPLALDLEIHPPDSRRRDVDNIIASLKSGVDGICDALGVDDSRFRQRTDAMGDPVRGGVIYVRVRGAS